MDGIIDCEMHIGDEVYVHGYVDEIRKDCIIIRNDGGYFGTIRNEIRYIEGDEIIPQREADTPQTEEEILREQCRAFMDVVKQTESLEQFRVGLEYHTDTTHFGKAKGESVTTNKIDDEPQTDCPWR